MELRIDDKVLLLALLLLLAYRNRRLVAAMPNPFTEFARGKTAAAS